MLTIAAPCPRCKEPRTTLQLVYSDPPVPGAAGNQRVDRESVFRCAHCQKYVIVSLAMNGGTPINQPLAPINPHQAYNYPSGDILRHQAIQVVEIQPRMPKDEIPEFLPTQVVNAFADGLALITQRRWTAAAGQFRTAIDRTTQLLWAEKGDGTEMPFKLGKRIEKLAAKLAIPATLVEWADAVRGVGNEIHALDDVLELDAQDAGHFCEVFLTYTYTLPERLAQMRTRKAEAETTAAAQK